MIFKMMPRTKLLLAVSALAVAGAMALLTPATSQREARPNAEAGTDRYHDPLPLGAVARLGSLRFCHGAPVEDVTLSPDGKWVASTAKDGNCLWDTATGREVSLGDGLKHAFLFVARGKLLAAQQEPGGTIVRDLVTAEEAPVAAEEIAAARSRNRRDDRVLSPDGTIRAEADGGRINFAMPAPPEACRIRLWDVGSGQELPPLEQQQPDWPFRPTASSWPPRTGWARRCACGTLPRAGPLSRSMSRYISLRSCGDTMVSIAQVTTTEMHTCGENIPRFTIRTISFSMRHSMRGTKLSARLRFHQKTFKRF
jgi:hypothetical protein